jgi:hypothetical protein
MRNWDSTVVQINRPAGSQLVTGTEQIRLDPDPEHCSEHRRNVGTGTVLTSDLYSKLKMYITFVAMARTSDATQISVKASRSLFLTDSHGQTEKDYLKKMTQLLLCLELRTVLIKHPTL